MKQTAAKESCRDRLNREYITLEALIDALTDDIPELLQQAGLSSQAPRITYKVIPALEEALYNLETVCDEVVAEVEKEREEEA